MKDKHNSKQAITININSLVHNLVIVNTNENDTAEMITQKITNALESVVATVSNNVNSDDAKLP